MAATLQAPQIVFQSTGHAISLALSKRGDLYAGWSNGAIVKLFRGTETHELYTSGGQDAPTSLQRQTLRSEFKFVHPIGIDAWYDESAQYIADSGLKAIFVIRGGVVSLIAGNGTSGRKDGDALTEATFDQIHSIAVSPQRIAVLGNGFVRFIHRLTHRVTTMKFVLFPAGTPLWLPTIAQPSPKNTLAVVYSTSGTLATHFMNLANAGSIDLTPKPVSIFSTEDGSRALLARKTKESFTIISKLGDSETSHALSLELIQNNILPVYCPISDSLFAYRHGMVFVFREVQGVKESKPSLTFKFEDCSLLLAPSTGLKSDLKIIHKASNSTLNLHRSVIDRKMYLEGPSPFSISERLAAFVSASTLPINVINQFIDHLYFKRPLYIKSTSILVTLALISKDLYGEEDPLLLEALQVQVNGDTDSSVCECLLLTWMSQLGLPFKVDETSLIVATLLPRVQQNRNGFKSAFDIFLTKSSQNTLPLISRMTLLLALVYGPIQDVILPDIQNPECYRFAVSAPPSDNQFLSSYSTNFIFKIPNCESIGACGWLLYVQWPWFKGLVDSGLVESKTRLVSLPANSFTWNALLAVLSVLQVSDTSFINSLTLEDHKSLLQSAEAFGLINQNGKSFARIAPLIHASEAYIFPRTTITNCWSQLHLAISIDSNKHMKRLFTFIVGHYAQFPTAELVSLPDEAVLELMRTARVKHAKPLATMF